MKRTPKPETPKQGRAYVYDGKLYRAGLVNPCRCRLDPLFKRPRVIVSRLHDYTKTIHTTPPSLNISANAQLLPAIY